MDRKKCSGGFTLYGRFQRIVIPWDTQYRHGALQHLRDILFFLSGGKISRNMIKIVPSGFQSVKSVIFLLIMKIRAHECHGLWKNVRR